MAWMRDGKYPDMPFNQQMTFPCDLTLRTLNGSLRVFRKPVREIERLHGKEHSWSDIALAPGAPMPLEVHGDLFRILAEVEIPEWLGPGLPHPRHARGPHQPGGRLQLQVRRRRYGALKTVEILVDRTSIESFANEGEVSLGVLPPRGRPARACQRPGAGTHPLTSRVRDQVDVDQELRITHFSVNVVRDDHQFHSTANSQCGSRDSSRVFSSRWRSWVVTALSASR